MFDQSDLPARDKSLLLPFGVNEKGGFIFIGDVKRGKSGLHCPFCTQLLTAKKGLKKRHHFAHINSSCVNWPHRKGDINLSLPLWDHFREYTPQESAGICQLFELLGRAFYASQITEHIRNLIRTLPENVLEDDFHYDYRLSLPALVAAKSLSLTKFAAYQALVFSDVHAGLKSRLVYHLKYGYTGDDMVNTRANEMFFRQSVRRLKNQNLYFAEISGDGEKFWKIGVTARPDFGPRSREIERDLRPHFKSVKIKILHFKKNMGRTERYFKFRHSEKRMELGTYTEYFRFGKEISGVKRDLTRLGEEEILSEIGNPDRSEKMRDVQTLKLLRGEQEEKPLGRPKQPDQDFMLKHSVLKFDLNEGLSVRAIARKRSISVNTVQKFRELSGLKERS